MLHYAVSDASAVEAGSTGRRSLSERLTVRRVQLYCLLILVVIMACWSYWTVSGTGLLDRSGHPIGGDFINYWSGSKLALEGRPEAVFTDEIKEVQQTTMGSNQGYFPWHYPPHYLLLILPLALLPLVPSLLAWWALTVPLYLLAVRTVTRSRLVLLPALALPAFYVNLIAGQNAFLTTAVVAFGLALLDRRPLAAGAVFGLLSCKPQFLPAVVLVLVATGRWKALSTMVASAAALMAASAAVFGPGMWSAFIDHLSVSSDIIFHALVPWRKMETLTSTLLLLGATPVLALAAQIVLSSGVGLVLAAIWRSSAAIELKKAGLVVAILLTTPYAMEYDLALTALPLLWLWTRASATGWRAGEKGVMTAVSLLPWYATLLAARTHLMVTPFVLLGFFALFVLRARQEQHEAIPGEIASYVVAA